MLPRNLSRRVFLKGLGMGTGMVLAGLPGLVRAAETWKTRTHHETRLLMGTIVRMTVARASATQAEEAMGRAFSEMERLIAVFDRHRPGTALSDLNVHGSLSDVPGEFSQLLAQASAYGRLTGHAFDITVLPVLELLDAHSNPGGVMTLPGKEFAEALALVHPDGVRTRGSGVYLERSGMRITLDGIAKGYIADQAAAVLEKHGLTHYLINAGGDIRCGGEKRPGVPWTVAVEDPAKRLSYPAVLPLRGGAVATSGVYERYFDKARTHNHLILPGTGASPTDRLSVTVTAPTAMEADVLATALSVMPQRAAWRLIEGLPGRSCLFVAADGRTLASSGWKRA